jgi:hypothetical protein
MSHQAQTRDLLIKQRPALKAKVNNLLSSEGINLRRESYPTTKLWNGCYPCRCHH